MLMLRATKQIFVEGALRYPGDEFPAERHWKHTVIVDGGQEPGEIAPAAGGKKMNRKQMMAELTAAGVGFKVTATSEQLEELLAKARGEIAPAAAAVPSKETAGVGDQDVI